MSPIFYRYGGLLSWNIAAGHTASLASYQICRGSEQNAKPNPRAPCGTKRNFWSYNFTFGQATFEKQPGVKLSLYQFFGMCRRPPALVIETEGR